MSAKAVFVLCAQALIIQLALGQAIYPTSSALGNTIVENAVVGASGAAIANNVLGFSGSGLGLTNNGFGLTGNEFGLANTNLASNAFVANANPAYLSLASLSGGGVLPVTSYSPLVPSGMTVVSDNNIEGQIVVNGQLPFLSAVAFEGTLSSDGQGSTSCGCGDGTIGIINENFIPATTGLGRGGLGPNGLGRSGLGGRFY